MLEDDRFGDELDRAAPQARLGLGLACDPGHDDNGDSGVSDLPLVKEVKIGRASCRERVGSCGAGGSPKNTGRGGGGDPAPTLVPASTGPCDVLLLVAW